MDSPRTKPKTLPPKKRRPQHDAVLQIPITPIHQKHKCTSVSIVDVPTQTLRHVEIGGMLMEPWQTSFEADDECQSESASAVRNISFPTFEPPHLLDEAPCSLTYCETHPTESSNQHPYLYQRWTATEDKILNHAVMETSGGVPPIRWKRISLEYFMGLRSVTQCRYRWMRVVNPQLKVGAWTKQEDDLIRMLRHDQGMHFIDIAKQIPGRRWECIRDRYEQVLDPDLRKGLWSDAEKAMLLALVSSLGNKWKDIVPHFPGRSAASCRSTWHNIMLSLKRKHDRRMKTK